MSILQTKQLPRGGVLSKSEFDQARELLVRSITDHYQDIRTTFNSDLFFLINYEENGKLTIGAETFREFVQWLTLLMLRPDNAQALHDRFKERGPLILDRLKSFFEGIVADDSRMEAFISVFDLEEHIGYMSNSTLYDKWKEYVNPDQVIPNF